jgi:translation initiation factor IF-1
MAKEEAMTLTGKVVKVEKNGFIVECSQSEGGSHLVSARLSGKLRKNYIRIVAGDEVDVEVSPYDVHKGRITYRKK